MHSPATRSAHAPHRRTAVGGFTLVELLIVCSIIAVLATIGVQNYLYAGVRAKVSRVRSDMRTTAAAIESYHADWNKYPFCYWWVGSPPTAAELKLGDMAGTPEQNYGELSILTTPVAYLAAVPEDPFNRPHPYDYTHLMEGYTREGVAHSTDTWWSLRSYGPNGKRDKHDYYDPTNGIVSSGDIVRTNEADK